MRRIRRCREGRWSEVRRKMVEVCSAVLRQGTMRDRAKCLKSSSNSSLTSSLRARNRLQLSSNKRTSFCRYLKSRRSPKRRDRQVLSPRRRSLGRSMPTRACTYPVITSRICQARSFSFTSTAMLSVSLWPSSRCEPFQTTATLASWAWNTRAMACTKKMGTQMRRK